MGTITRSLASMRSRLPIDISVCAMSAQGYVASSKAPEREVYFEKVGDEKRGYQGLVVLDRPKALNALNLSMVNKIYPQLKSWEDTVSAVILEAAGDKAFCAGGDVKSIVLRLNEPGGEIHGYDFFRHEYRLDHLLGTYKKPVVSIIHGIVMGGGVGLSVHGNYRVATENTLFAMPETAIGLSPDVGATYFLPRLQGKLGVFLGLTGYRLKGVDVLHAGVATHFVTSNKRRDVIEALITRGPRDIPEILDGFQHFHSEHLKKEFSLAPHMGMINECFSADTVEEIVSRLKADGGDFSKEILQTMSKMSPTSLKIAKAAIERGRDLSLADCLKMEYRICCASHRRDGDFYEGVRALLIDKDQKPEWKPKTLEEVTDEKVQEYLTKIPPPGDLEL